MSQSKKLVIYYSLEGNTRLIAETISQATGADLLELQPKQNLNPKGFSKYFWGGKQVVMKEKPQLLPLDKQPEDYDLLFIGAPVWAWSYAAPLNTFFSTVKLQNKRIALFCCHGGQKGKTFENMRLALAGNEILGEKDFLDPLKRQSEKAVKETKEWSSLLID